MNAIEDDFRVYELVRMLSLWKEHHWKETTAFGLSMWAQESAARTRLSPRPELGCDLLVKLSLARIARDGGITVESAVVSSWGHGDFGLERVPKAIALLIVERLLAHVDTAATLDMVFASIPLSSGSLETVWDRVESAVRREPGWIWLQHLGLCEHDGCVVRCASELRCYLAGAMQVTRPMTQAELEERLKAQSRLADAAEEYVVKQEQDRLRESGHDDLAEGVYRISPEDVRAGFDVYSFEVNGQRRHIEVKASAGPRRHFFLSDNELSKGREYGDAYWLAWVGFAERLPEGPVDMAWFRNPIAVLDLDGGPWEIAPHDFIVVRRGDDSLVRADV